MLRFASVLALLPCLLVACAAADERADSSASAVVAPPQGDIAQFDATIGDFHPAGQYDVVNISIKEGGTYVWNVSGCDYYGSACGTYKASPDGMGIVLQPSNGKLEWLVDDQLVDVASVRVQRGGDTLYVDVTTKEGSQVRQEWQSGATCATCEPGPSGLIEGPTAPATVCKREITNEWCE